MTTVSCPSGLESMGHPPVCEDKNECIWQPCGYEGRCHNIEGGHGYWCECTGGRSCHNCSCDGLIIMTSGKSVGLGGGAMAIIFACLIVYLLLVLVIVAYSRTRRPDQKCRHGDVDDDVRENIISYDDEGGGEDDMNAYDITHLRIPIDATGTPIVGKSVPDKNGLLKDSRQRPYLGPHPDIGEFIREHLEKVDSDPNAPPFDDLRNYAFEGSGSPAGSLSSLASGTDDNEQDFDYLNGWGPRFQKLADMYQQGESEDE